MPFILSHADTLHGRMRTIFIYFHRISIRLAHNLFPYKALKFMRVRNEKNWFFREKI